MRPLCHKCNKKPADIIENKKFWCAVCKIHEMRVYGKIPPELTKDESKHKIKLLK